VALRPRRLAVPQPPLLISCEDPDVTVRPYGTWPSSLDADTIASIPRRAFDALSIAGPAVRWTTARPADEGRNAVVEWRDGTIRDLSPTGANARTRVHEYGGRALWFHGDTGFYSEFSDGRLYRLADAFAAPITPEPPEPGSLRYADGDVTPDGRLVVCVRERHEGGEVHNELVALPADGSAEPRIVASGHDFYGAPRISPDGGRLAWICWDHPRMPWDGTELRVAQLDGDGTLSDEQLVAGGSEESVLEPAWSPNGRLHFVTDRNGWWNLHREDRALTALEDGEIGCPAFVFGTSRYAFLGDGRIACVVTRAAVDSLELLDPDTGALEPAGLGWTSYAPTMLAVAGSRVVFAASSPSEPATVVLWAADSGEETVLHRVIDLALDPAGVSVPRAIEFPTTDGVTAHAFYYPPTSSGSEGPADELPPLRVVCHGGPTANSTPSFTPAYLFWTQRGIGVVDVNYRGSSGYGREYRRLLDGRWGEIDWQDCVAAARHLGERGEADPERTWVEGGSAGGYVAFCSLTFEPESFAAGVALYGVADVEALALETHKFESRYLDSLIGAYPERADLYRARSPIHFADRLERPLLVLQGLDDKVVLPSQSEVMVDAAERKGIPHAYIAFEGEGHGFRKRENVRRAFEAELSFVGQIFGFEPADELEPLEIRHL
jgi:dipeptidyl aminopeptidase/acylaminoacyl peptidase